MTGWVLVCMGAYILARAPLPIKFGKGLYILMLEVFGALLFIVGILILTNKI